MIVLNVLAYSSSFKTKTNLINKVSRQWLTTTILTVGKKNSVEPWIVGGCFEYEKRISSIINIQTMFLKDNEALIDNINTIRGTIIALDETGIVIF